MIFEINVNVEESYLCGVAKRTNGDMRLISRGQNRHSVAKRIVIL